MFEALYVGESQHIALLETEALILIGGKFKGIKQPPRAMLSIDVTLQHVISLHDPALLHRLGHKPAELLLPWRRAMLAGRPVLTQCIGAAASAVGIEALLVPSAKDPAYSNLAIFSANLYVGSSVTLYDPSTTAPPHIVKGHRTR